MVGMKNVMVVSDGGSGGGGGGLLRYLSILDKGT